MFDALGQITGLRRGIIELGRQTGQSLPKGPVTLVQPRQLARSLRGHCDRLPRSAPLPGQRLVDLDTPARNRFRVLGRG